MSSLVHRLLQRGDQVEIIDGRILIKPASRKIVCEAWLSKNRLIMLREISEKVQLDLVTYYKFNTHRKPYPAVCLTLEVLRSGAPCYSIFNVDLNRRRNTKTGKKGTPLPGKQFRFDTTSNIWKFWRSTKLANPRQMSALNESMGKLKALIFCAKQIKNERIQNPDLIPFTMPPEDMRIAFGVSVNNSPPISQRDINKNSTRFANKDTSSDQTTRGATQHLGTCTRDHDISNQDNARQEDGYSRINPIDQSRDEWLADYDQPITQKGFRTH